MFNALGIIAYNNTNVYAQPGSGTNIVARLYDGAEVVVLNEYNGWYLIQFGDQVGYAAEEFIELQ